MDTSLKTMIWQQFGAAIDMLDNAMRACPDQLWRESVWIDPTDAPEYGEFWFIVYHTLYWLDLYLSGTVEGFAPPARFTREELDLARPYSRDELQTYLDHCRQKCRATFEALTDEKANQRCEFPWGEEVSFAELQLYSMRHVQEHAAQLSLHLGQKGVSAPDWVARAEHKTA